MSLHPTIPEAQQALSQLELPPKRMAFLQKSFEVLDSKPIRQIEVVQGPRWAQIVVFYEDGDEREYSA